MDLRSGFRIVLVSDRIGFGFEIQTCIVGLFLLDSRLTRHGDVEMWGRNEMASGEGCRIDNNKTEERTKGGGDGGEDGNGRSIFLLDNGGVR